MQVTAIRFFKQYWKDYATGIFFLVATNGLAASVPMLIKHIIDALKQGQNTHASHMLFAILVIVVVMFVVRIASRYCLIGVGRKIEFNVRYNLYQHLLSMPRSYYDVQQTGDLMSRLTNDLTALRMFLGGGIMLITNVIIAYCIILPLMMTLSWRLTLFAFILYPLVVSLMRVLSRRVKRLSHEVQDNLGSLTAVAQENFSGINVIQSYAKEKEESYRFYEASKGYFKANNHLVRARALLYILIAGVSGVSILIVLGEGGREVIVKGLTISGFTAFMLYLERLSWPTVSMGWILSSMQQGLAAIERINRVFDAAPTITDAKADPTLTSLPQPFALAVQNLSFRYENPYAPAQAAVTPPWVLQNIQFRVNPGEILAVVGPIGSGKTTLLNLLSRLYAPPDNTVFYGDHALETIPLATLRQMVALMPQNAFLFSDSMQQNIAYAAPDTILDRIYENADTARIHEEILGFPDEYQTVMGERGITLSGGQRQRTTLARTLLAAPTVLLLDDPFSSVDTETETEIIEALQTRKQLANRITVFASQRFALVRQADHVLVLNAQGEMADFGTHSELINRSALYQDLNQGKHLQTIQSNAEVLSA